MESSTLAFRRTEDYRSMDNNSLSMFKSRFTMLNFMPGVFFLGIDMYIYIYIERERVNKPLEKGRTRRTRGLPPQKATGFSFQLLGSESHPSLDSPIAGLLFSPTRNDRRDSDHPCSEVCQSQNILHRTRSVLGTVGCCLVCLNSYSPFFLAKLHRDGPAHACHTRWHISSPRVGAE